MFSAMEDNAYMQERAADVKDVSTRILAALLGVKLPSPATISEEVVIIAHDLTPSDTAQLKKQAVCESVRYKYRRTYFSLGNNDAFFRDSSNCWYKLNCISS